MMKILFYNHTGKVSGAEKVLLTTLSGLDRNTFDAAVLCPEEGTLVTMLAERGIKTEVCPTLDARFTLRLDRLAKYVASALKVVRSVRSTIKKTNPDLVHANSIRAGLVTTLATLGLRTHLIWHLHDILPRHPMSISIRLFALLFRRARMIAVSRAVADNFAGKFQSLRNRTTVIYNGIDAARFSYVLGRRADIRCQFDLSESDFVVGIVGLLTPRKGQLGLIHSFARVVKDVPNARLLIVGSPVFNKDHEYADELKRTVSRLGLDDRVSFIGPRNDIPDIMQSIDLLVVNSTVEPFGLVVVEAMACGTPVVAAISGGIPEIIEHQKSGWLVENGNEAVLSAAIVHLAKSPSRLAQLARGAKQRSLAFTSSRYLNELFKFYLTLKKTRDVKRNHSTTVTPQAAQKIAC